MFFIEGIKNAAPTLAILIAVGALVGTWIAWRYSSDDNILPLRLNKSRLFGIYCVYFVLYCFCRRRQLIYVAATFGVAFMGIGLGMGINPALLAGACVSGSIFGDKLSPFSDTTNLAPAIAGTNLFSHIKPMLWTIRSRICYKWNPLSHIRIKICRQQRQRRSIRTYKGYYSTEL